MNQKVLAYVVRPGSNAWQLPVFKHAHDSEAGVQVAAEGEGHGLRLDYYWVEIGSGLRLASGQDRWVG